MIALFNSRKRKIKKALKVALQDFDRDIIIEIMTSECENERYGWGNGAEFLNKARPNEVKEVLNRI